MSLKKEGRNVSCLASGRYKDENSRPLATSVQLKKNDELRLYKCVRRILLPQSVAELQQFSSTYFRDDVKLRYLHIACLISQEIKSFSVVDRFLFFSL
jgi:hypothetical protein